MYTNFARSLFDFIDKFGKIIYVIAMRVRYQDSVWQPLRRNSISYPLVDAFDYAFTCVNKKMKNFFIIALGK
jgi:hypothetical protein